MTNSKNHYNKVRKQLHQKRREIKTGCPYCNSIKIHSIDSYWECSRPYKIYMCFTCRKIFGKYDDENKFRTMQDMNDLIEELKQRD